MDASGSGGFARRVSERGRAGAIGSGRPDARHGPSLQPDRARLRLGADGRPGRDELLVVGHDARTRRRLRARRRSVAMRGRSALLIAAAAAGLFPEAASAHCPISYVVTGPGGLYWQLDLDGDLYDGA